MCICLLMWNFKQLGMLVRTCAHQALAIMLLRDGPGVGLRIAMHARQHACKCGMMQVGS